MTTDDFFRARLDQMIDLRHPLAVLAQRLPWGEIEKTIALLFAHRERAGRVVADADLVSVAVTHRHGLMVGARSFPGNPYDGHTLAAQIEQTTTLLQDLGVKPTTAVVDLGDRGVDRELAPVQVIHRSKSKSLSAVQRG